MTATAAAQESSIRARDALYPPGVILTGEKLDRRILLGIIDDLRDELRRVQVAAAGLLDEASEVAS